MNAICLPCVVVQFEIVRVSPAFVGRQVVEPGSLRKPPAFYRHVGGIRLTAHFNDHHTKRYCRIIQTVPLLPCGPFSIAYEVSLNSYPLQRRKTTTCVQDILDNPIWNALVSGNKNMAHLLRDAAYLKRDVGLFAGMKNNSAEEFDELSGGLPPKAQIILFTANEIAIPDSWQIKVNRPVLQMVYPHEQSPAADHRNIVPLEDKDIPAMLELTKMTNPGPFFSRTIEFGNYEGIFNGDQLIAMTGQRLQPFNYAEISAVCTHPDHTGKGYAAKLMLSQMSRITTAGRIPFLNVYPENSGACKLYWKLGFETRKEILVYFLEKAAP